MGGRGGLGKGRRGGLGGSRRSRRRRSDWGGSRRGGGAARKFLVALIVAAVVVVAIAIRVVTEPAPTLRAHTVLAASVTTPGTPPPAPWPAQGQGAFVIPGVATAASPQESPVQIASVAKVMTAYVVLKDHPFAPGQPGFSYTVTPADAADYAQREAQAQSIVPVTAGEVLTEQQLLEGLLIPSGNNYADMLAEQDAGSTDAFVAKMQAAAKALGMTATTYTDPSGFAGTTLSTAHDQALLAAAAMPDPVFAAIVAMHSATLPQAGAVHNYDTILGSDGFTGIKTGSDITAGGCFMFAATHPVDGKPATIYGAVLGQDVGTRNTTTLVNAAQAASQKIVDTELAAVTPQTVLPAGTPVLQVRNAQGKVVTAVTDAPLTLLAVPGTVVHLAAAVTPLGTAVRAGQQVATVTGPDGLHTGVHVTAASPAVTLGYKLEHIF
ncbi:MAG TPA: hypothetical protein VFP61_10330 [Acidimicrobiales bacterium]|nr:hypothetical protein [Acidimicrobiales bacterium]